VDITLHSSGLDDLSPRVYRSPGIHGSTLIDRLCLKYGHYQKNKDGSPISDRNREMGNVFEQVTCERFARQHPDELFLHNPEILCDGVYLTPDLVWLSYYSDIEIKWSWMSPANSPEDVKMWKYLTQGQAYLHGLRKVLAGEAKIREACTDKDEVLWRSGLDFFPRHFPPPGAAVPSDAFTTLYLTVGFANDFRPQSEQIPCWRIKFWPEELAMNWAMLMDEKAILEAEMWEQELMKGQDQA